MSTAAARCNDQPLSHSRGPPPASSSSTASSARPQWQRPQDSNAKLHRYRPTTTSAEAHVYVLTLRLSSSLHDPLNALRSRHFPPHLLQVPAHLTLFHALPHSKLDDVAAALETVAAKTAPFRVTSGAAFRMGSQGVAVSPGEGAHEGAQVHGELRTAWAGFLSKQDAREFRAHWTIMNKVGDEDKVARAFAEVRQWAEREGAEGEADGLVLWRYAHGKWVFEREFVFAGRK
ncbi:hypothetical protein JCM21900_004222 [Sporobolomyces salmonicolor]